MHFPPYKMQIRGQTLWLSPARCIYWEEMQVLIVSDLHFGKSGHFRKEGIGVPQKVFQADLHRLFSQIQFFKPISLVVAGDMFHSRSNREMELFLKWRNDISWLPIHLVRGNHDILEPNFYRNASIEVAEEVLKMGDFSFIHDFDPQVQQEPRQDFVFCGHLHPGIRIRGAARQSLLLPCFYFSESHAVLPAFSNFSGMYTVRPHTGDQVFALVENQVLKL